MCIRDSSDLLLVLEAVNTSLDDIERHLNRAYIETWRYIQVRIGYWLSLIHIYPVVQGQ